MFSTLIWKEWRQARTLTLVGVGIGLLLPLALSLFAGEEATGRILSPFGKRDVFLSLCPAMFAFGLWPLWALMGAVQAFSVDESAGTSRFLLDRPVSRTKVWFARLLTGLASLFSVVCASLTGWALFGMILGGFSFAKLTGEFSGQVLSGIGILLLLALLMLVFCSGMLAASFGAHSFGGMLLGAAFCGFFGGAVFQLASFFYFLAPVILAVGLSFIPLLFLAASWLMLCRGEPAGRGRLLRGASMVLVVSMAIPLIFLVAAPSLLKQQCSALDVSSSDYFDSGWVGETVFLPSANFRYRAGWIVDPTTGKRLHFFPPFATAITYDQTGKRFALITDGSRYGSRIESLRVEIHQAHGEQIGKSTPVPAELWNGSLFFWNNQLFLMGSAAIYEVVYERGELEPVIEIPKQRHHQIVETRDTSELFLVLPATPSPEAKVPREDPDLNSSYVGLFPLDLEAGTLGRESVVVDSHLPWMLNRMLSPSGRFLFRTHEDTTKQLNVVEIDTGEEILLSEQRRPILARWLPEDRLAWIESSASDVSSSDSTQTLMTWAPGEESVAIRAWEPGTGVWIEPEPRGHRLLVSTSTGGVGDAQVSFEIWNPRTGQWTELPSQVDGERSISRGSWIGTGAVGVSVRGSDDTYSIDLDQRNCITPL